MAIWLHLKEGAKLVDDKMRKLLLTNYAKVNAKRRERKVKKLQGTIWQLYQAGQYQQGDQI